MEQNKKNNNINLLCNLLNFGTECFEKLKFEYNRIRIRNRLFLLMAVAAHNYTESIFSLCKQNRTHACFPLLRSLVENRINAKSLFASETMDGVYQFQIAGYEEQKKVLKGLVLINKSIPSHQIQIKISDTDLMNTIKVIDKNIKKIEIKIKNKNSPKKLYNLALEIDKFNTIKNKKSASLHSEYESIYRHLCSHSHLTIQGLEQFKSTKQGFQEFFLSGNPEDVELIVQLAGYLYEDILKMVLIRFKLPRHRELKQILKTYKKVL
jgi:uncharacterized protein DUF5677